MKASFKGAAPRIIISFLSLAVIVYMLRNKLGESFAILRSEVSWDWFLACVFAYAIVQAIMAYRLYRIFSIQEIQIKYKDTLYLCIVGLFFNLFLPSAVGGDVAKIYYAFKHSGKKIAATTAVILDRLVGFVAIMTIAFTAMALYGRNMLDARIERFVYGFIVVMLAMVAVLGSRRISHPLRTLGRLIPSKKIREKGSQIYDAIHSCRRHYGVLLFCVLISIAGQSLVILIYYWLSDGLGCQVGPEVFFLVIPVVTIVSMAPSLGGLGVREAGAIYLFSKHMTSERALALSLLVDMIIYGFGLASGFAYAMAGGLRAKNLQELESKLDEFA